LSSNNYGIAQVTIVRMYTDTQNTIHNNLLYVYNRSRQNRVSMWHVYAGRTNRYDNNGYT